MIGHLEMTDFAGAQLAPVEQKQYLFFGIPMVGHVQDLGDCDLDAALLLALTDQSLFR